MQISHGATTVFALSLVPFVLYTLGEVMDAEIMDVDPQQPDAQTLHLPSKSVQCDEFQMYCKSSKKDPPCEKPSECAEYWDYDYKFYHWNGPCLKGERVKDFAEFKSKVSREPKDANECIICDGEKWCEDVWGKTKTGGCIGPREECLTEKQIEAQVTNAQTFEGVMIEGPPGTWTSNSVHCDEFLMFCPSSKKHPKCEKPSQCDTYFAYRYKFYHWNGPCEKDKHGCIPCDGEKWCEDRKKCIDPREPCPVSISHGN